MEEGEQVHPDNPVPPVLRGHSVPWAMGSQGRKVPEPGEGGGWRQKPLVGHLVL